MTPVYTLYTCVRVYVYIIIISHTRTFIYIDVDVQFRAYQSPRITI